MRYCFFGLNPGAMTRYPAGVAGALEALDPEAEFHFIVDDDRGLEGVRFPDRSTFLHRGAPTATRVRALLDEAAPDALVTTAQRIPDSVFVSAARDRGTMTFMFQHGLYLPFMKREASLFLRKAVKTLHYVRYAALLARMHGASPVRYVRELSAVFVRGKGYSRAQIDRDRMNVDLVLLNGEFWRAFHTRQYGYPPECQVVVGYPDYDQLPAIEQKPRQDAVCYVAQTLVEHGRLDENAYRSFLRQLSQAVTNRPLLVKLHPASNVDLYAELASRPNVHLVHDILPHATHYVGHYSTYLALVPFLSRNLLLWELEGHPIPDSIRPAASTVTRDPETLRRFLHSGGPAEPRAADVARWKQYFYRGPETAFEAAASQIAEHLNAAPSAQ